MPRYKEANYAQGQFVSIQFEHQILPGSFEHALCYVIDHKINMSAFDALRKNDDVGAPAYDPRVMLKIVLAAYARGMISSRDIAFACEQNVVFMALSARSVPHFTTIAQFIREMGPVIKGLFVDVLLYCDELGLIGREMFAIDGCKISSNASKEWSGTKEDFEKKKAKFSKLVETLVAKHKEVDAGKQVLPAEVRAKEEKAIKSLEDKIATLDEWLKTQEDKISHTGLPKKSHLYDNESAKMVSSHGVVQGYNGVAAVDGECQVVVSAEAFGEGSEVKLLEPMVDSVEKTFAALGDTESPLKSAPLLADSGFHSEANMKMLEGKEINGYVADRNMRKRDPSYATADRHGGKIEGIQGTKPEKRFFAPDDFKFNDRGKLVCPAGSELYIGYRKHVTPNGFYGVAYKAKITACRGCELRAKCLQNPNTKYRQVYKFEGRHRPPAAVNATTGMIQKIDSAMGRFIYSRRMGLIEPVFGNIRHALGLDRFTLRGKKGQHPVEALQHGAQSFKDIPYGWTTAMVRAD
ncbi:MAG: transposase [Elusimicrobia bacterium]|nr:transposase [Elusimicrobiota bacterium]